MGKLFLIAALLQILWGLTPTASNIVISEIPVELYIALRWTISGFIFAAYIVLTGGWKKVSFGTLVRVSALGILAYGIASIGTLYGLKTGGVTNFALMTALGPAITSLLAILVLKERPRWIFYFALPVSILGLLILVAGKYQVSSLTVAGQSMLFILAGCALEALAFVFSKKFKTQMGTAQYLAIAQISAALLMWSLQIGVFHQTDKLVLLSSRGIAATVFVSVVACVLCYGVLYWLLNHIDGHRLALFDGFHTLSAVIFGWLVFHEAVSYLMLVGGFLILTGLIMGNLISNSMFTFTGKTKTNQSKENLPASGIGT